MKVEKIYMDLKEAKLEDKFWKDVWVLESEAFKDPITLQIGYTDKDRERVEACKKVIENQVKDAERVLQKIEDKTQEHRDLINSYREELKKKDEKIEELEKEIEKTEKEKIKVLQETKELKTTVENQNEQLATLKEILAKIKEKISRESRVYSGQTFISWNWTSALTALKLQDWNYIALWTTKIVEKNEYVENEDVEVGGYNIHVTDGIWTPEYELKGTTQLDTPTATVNWTFTLIPS